MENLQLNLSKATIKTTTFIEIYWQSRQSEAIYQGKAKRTQFAHNYKDQPDEF